MHLMSRRHLYDAGDPRQPHSFPTRRSSDLGHVVVDLDGPPCQGDCPGRGCLEVMASGTAIGREGAAAAARSPDSALDRKSTRLNSSHRCISYGVFCLKKKMRF